MKGARHMKNRDIMLATLKEHVLPGLSERGFAGKYPHYRRVNGNCIELISFLTNKYGGAFTVEASVAFPNNTYKNYKLYENMTEATLNVTATNSRYRLPGMQDGWFYYFDIYRKRTLLFGNVYHAVSEKQSEAFEPTKGYKLYQKFNEQTALHICDEVNLQLKKAFLWMEKFKAKHS